MDSQPGEEGNEHARESEVEEVSGQYPENSLEWRRMGVGVL